LQGLLRTFSRTQDMLLQTLTKRIPTNEEGVFYKRIINDKGKEVDKVFMIRYRENSKDKIKTDTSIQIICAIFNTDFNIKSI